MFKVCQVYCSLSVWPLKVSVPMINSTAVEARKVAAMVELRNVWMAKMLLFSSCMILFTQAVRAAHHNDEQGLSSAVGLESCRNLDMNCETEP